jgi:hypothetical protein
MDMNAKTELLTKIVQVLAPGEDAAVALLNAVADQYNATVERRDPGRFECTYPGCTVDPTDMSPTMDRLLEIATDRG